MLQAYCRGLLTPYYTHGMQSRVREYLVLYALNCEEHSKEVESTLQNRAAWYGSHIDIKKSTAYIKNTERLVRYASEKRTYNPQKFDNMFRAAIEGSVESLIEMYKRAEESGEIQRFLERCKQLENEQ